MEEDHGTGNSSRQLIAAVVVIALIVLGGLWLSGALHRSDAVQDCAMSGRTNCAPAETQH